MPEISRFLGVVIGMFYSEHGVPHFHAVYGEHEASIVDRRGHSARFVAAEGAAACAGMAGTLQDRVAGELATGPAGPAPQAHSPVGEE